MSDNFHQHRVRPGETLSGIAREFGVRSSDLKAANPDIHDPNLIVVDQIINIPQSVSEAAAPTRTPGVADPNVLLERYSPTGASDNTAKQDDLPERGITGVKASETMAKTDQKRVMQHK